MDIQTAAAKIKNLTPSDQLRLAADLLEQAKQYPARATSIIKLANSIISPIATETGALIALDLVRGQR